ncbi:MAG: hypothetical protein GX610_20135 [Rhodococcus sp.]|nr:hypothetical protein [Rhodococcus sp. (in: high G+C Gram-positive bacteria)]
MNTGVGLYVGETQSVAVVTTPGSAIRTIERATVLSPQEDGSVELGTRSENSVEGFVTRVGETGGIVYRGADTSAEDLIATAMFCLFRDLAPELHGDVDVVAAHPSGWSQETVDALRESLDYMGLKHARLVSADVAVALSTDSFTTSQSHTDEEVDSPVSESRPGWAAAHGGALIASGAALSPLDSGLETESIPVVPHDPPTAYSQAIISPAAEYSPVADGGAPLAGAAAAAAAAETVPAATPPAAAATSTKSASEPADDNRRPILFAGAAAAVLVLAGVAIALTVGNTGTTDAPEIRDAKVEATTTTPSSKRSTTINFPTVTAEEVAVTTPPQSWETPNGRPMERSVSVIVPPPVETTPVAPPPVETATPPVSEETPQPEGPDGGQDTPPPTDPTDPTDPTEPTDPTDEPTEPTEPTDEPTDPKPGDGTGEEPGDKGGADTAAGRATDVSGSSDTA